MGVNKIGILYFFCVILEANIFWRFKTSIHPSLPYIFFTVVGDRQLELERRSVRIDHIMHQGFFIKRLHRESNAMRVFGPIWFVNIYPVPGHGSLLQELLEIHTVFILRKVSFKSEFY